MKKERKINFLTMMYPVMARCVKDQFQRTKVINDLFKAKGIFIHAVITNAHAIYKYSH